MKNIIMLLFGCLLLGGVLFAGYVNHDPHNFALDTNNLPFDTMPSPSPAPFSTNPIRIVSPVENARLPAVPATYVYGSVPAAGKLFINGIPVPIHPGGGFLVMVQLSPGKFHINAELQLGNVSYRLVRTVFVAGPDQPAPVSPLTIDYVTPRQDQELLPGDYVNVGCKGSPGMQAYFTVKGVRRRFPMTESETGPAGIYHGIYRIGNKDRLKKARIKVTLVDNQNRKISREAEGRLSLFPEHIPVMVEVIASDVVLRAGPALALNERAGYMMFPPIGTVLQITGRIGDEYRVRLTQTKTVWVSVNQVKPLPKGTLPARVVAGSISINTAQHSTIIHLPLARKVPFEIVPDGEGKSIDISFFGVFSNTDWITNAITGAVKSIRWFQDDEETYRLRVDTIPDSWWGYDVRYEKNGFILELRSPPPAIAGNLPLTGLTIAVDAGHSMDGGVIGPTGYAEGAANYAIAVHLKEKLLAKGAKVVMIRQGAADIPLSERPKIAWQNKADLLISIHNNSLPYGGNPLVKHGYGVYYFTPMSLPLAKEIYAAYGETFRPGGEFNLPGDGLYYGNLALIRSPRMPSVLIESAYMIVPEEEAYLKTEQFRSACANAIVQGIERFINRLQVKDSKLIK